MSKVLCKNCKFFEKNTKKEDGNLGQCLKNPPQVSTQILVSQLGQPQPMILTFFPIISKDSEGCFSGEEASKII